jgi:hypothetical protein
MLVAEVGGGGCAEVGGGVSVFVIINRGFFVGITWMYLWFGVCGILFVQLFLVVGG